MPSKRIIAALSGIAVAIALHGGPGGTAFAATPHAVSSTAEMRLAFPTRSACVATATLALAVVAPPAIAKSTAAGVQAWLAPVVSAGHIDQLPRHSVIAINEGCHHTLAWKVLNSSFGTNPNDFRQNFPVVACEYIATPPGLRPKQAAENGEGVGITVVLQQEPHGLVAIAVTTASATQKTTQLIPTKTS